MLCSRSSSGGDGAFHRRGRVNNSFLLSLFCRFRCIGLAALMSTLMRAADIDE